MKRINNIIFLIVIFFIFLLGFYPFVRKSKTISTLENRTLNKIPSFTFDKYFEGNYQIDIEKALSDQFLGGEKIKKYYNEVLNRTTNIIDSIFNIKGRYCINDYIVLSEGRGIFNCSDYIVFIPTHSEHQSDILTNISDYSKLDKYVDTYYYYVPASAVFDFRTNTYVDDFVKEFENKLVNKGKIDYLKYNNFEEYKQLFYKNDHHWNYKGSYQGYKDIINLFGIHDGVMKPISTFNSHVSFYGSNSRVTRNYDFYDEFIIYKFDFKNHKTYINGKEMEYDHINDFINHKYKEDINRNYYAYVYGSDYAEVLFDFNNNKENLLIISNSLSNSVNELIASHFNKTYVVDLRHYKNEFNKDFKILKYIKEKEINKVLFIMNHNSLQLFNIGLEE